MNEVGAISNLEGKQSFEVQYRITECYKHSYEKVIVYLNYDDDKNIDVKTEREKFEDIVEDSLLKNSRWYLVPCYTECKTNKRRFDHSNDVEFVLKRKLNTD